MKVNLKIAAAAALSNVVLVAAITASMGITQFVSSLIPAFIIFVFFVISFCAACYLAWHIYGVFANELDPAGQCVVGFILPFLTAFLATSNWSAFSKVAGGNQDSTIKNLSQFDGVSILMLFVIFLIGGLIWGFLMKSEQHESKRQGDIAAGYTVLSYWFGFIISSWLWLFWDAVT